MRKRIAVIGGGAAGMMAAITAAREGAEVTIYEHTERLGKKILSTGNGKCNLTNMDLSAEHYHSSNSELVKHCLQRFGVKESLAFFDSLGLWPKDKNGYIYPLAEQAAVVLDVLRYTVEALGIQVVTEAQVEKVYSVTNAGNDYRVCVENKGKKFFYHSVILACGSKAAPKTGSDGSGYDLAKSMGHTIMPVLPSLVQLKCSDSFCKALAGIRCEAEVHIYVGDEMLCKERGELQLTDYGISGIPVFQLSGLVNRRIYEMTQNIKKNQAKELPVYAYIDFLPEYTMGELQEKLDKRCESVIYKKGTVEEFFTGVLNKKLMLQLLKMADINPTEKVGCLSKDRLFEVLFLGKNFKMHITGSNGFENAQVCTGGVSMLEVSENLESLKAKGIYFAGEILDVDGRCGGYNLQWAWTSGAIAGQAATK